MKNNKYIVLEGVDAIGKTEIAQCIINQLKRQGLDYININRNTKLYLDDEINNETFLFSKNWFNNKNHEKTSTQIKIYMSVIQLRYLFEKIIMPALENDKFIIIDSWWGKSVCNLYYEFVAKDSFDKAMFYNAYEMIGLDSIERQTNFYVSISPDEAYKCYIKKGKPETILGKNNFNKNFYYDYVTNVQDLLEMLANKYNFTKINNYYSEHNHKEQIENISNKILNYCLNS